MSLTKREIQQLRICTELYHSNIDQHTNIVSLPNVQKAAFLTDSLWSPGNTITISFLPLPEDTENYPAWYDKDMIISLTAPGEKIDEIEQYVRDNFDGDKYNPAAAVKYVITQRLQPYVNLKFQWLGPDEGDGDVRILFDRRYGSKSLVGRGVFSENNKSNPTTWYGWLDVATIIHEMCHVLGMIHEHQNPRGQEIPWNKCALLTWGKTTQDWSDAIIYSNIVEKYRSDQINGSDFDPKSIMLYHFPADLTSNCKGTRYNWTLSDVDKQWLSYTYPGGSVKPVKPVPLISLTGGSSGTISNGASSDGTSSDSRKKRNKMIIILSIVFVVISLAIILFIHFNK